MQWLIKSKLLSLAFKAFTIFVPPHLSNLASYAIHIQPSSQVRQVSLLPWKTSCPLLYVNIHAITPSVCCWNNSGIILYVNIHAITPSLCCWNFTFSFFFPLLHKMCFQIVREEQRVYGSWVTLALGESWCGDSRECLVAIGGGIISNQEFHQ